MDESMECLNLFDVADGVLDIVAGEVSRFEDRLRLDVYTDAYYSGQANVCCPPSTVGIVGMMLLPLVVPHDLRYPRFTIMGYLPNLGDVMTMAGSIQSLLDDKAFVDHTFQRVVLDDVMNGCRLYYEATNVEAVLLVGGP